MRTIHLLVLVALATIVFPCLGQGTEADRMMLKGLRSCYVYVTLPDNPDIKDNYELKQIQNTVELRLRQAGIIVNDINSAKADSAFCVMINTMKTEEYLNRIDQSIIIILYQHIILQRDQNIRLLCPTWEDSVFGHSTKADAPSQIIAKVGSITDAFLNDWLAANPKPAAVAPAPPAPAPATAPPAPPTTPRQET